MGKIIALIIAICLIVGLTTVVILNQNNVQNPQNYSGNNEPIPAGRPEPEKPIEQIPVGRPEPETPVEEPATTVTEQPANQITNGLSEFDLSFLKIEQDEKNLIYSPLSIKYALKMLEEAANGESKQQIARLIGNYTPTKYKNSENMSLANSLWIKDDFKDEVKQSYIDTLSAKYSAELKFDSFKDATNINNWISEKTLNIIPKMLEDDDVKVWQFALINALAIDMEWEEKFLFPYPGGEEYHSYAHEDYYWEYPCYVSQDSFNNSEKKYSVIPSISVINNYDIVKELGEENIRNIVEKEYRNYMNRDLDKWFIDYRLNGEATEENINNEIKRYLEEYMEEISNNYGRTDTYHSYKINVTDKEKVFVKDLKEYNGTTLQYIGIMPTQEQLNKYVEKITPEKINELVAATKELKNENFKQGVITEIVGYIPKFKFEYELKLKNDLEEQGITNVFSLGNAQLTNLTDNDLAYIVDAKHKANVEFTQDGIKAAAATVFGGAGGGDAFDYIFKVPVETIDITFDKPYMFLIKDKNSGEVWFTGTVYEPLLYEEDATRYME